MRIFCSAAHACPPQWKIVFTIIWFLPLTSLNWVSCLKGLLPAQNILFPALHTLPRTAICRWECMALWHSTKLECFQITPKLAPGYSCALCIPHRFIKLWVFLRESGFSKRGSIALSLHFIPKFSGSGPRESHRRHSSGTGWGKRRSNKA